MGQTSAVVHWKWGENRLQDALQILAQVLVVQELY
jgi:hypothetical protein